MWPFSRAKRRSPPKVAQGFERLGRQRNLKLESLETREVFAVSFGSAIDIGGAGSDAVFDVAVDSAGNSYTAGYFTGTVDFDATHSLPADADILTARGSQDAFVAKYAPDDSLIWVRRMGGDYLNDLIVTDAARDVSVDAAGNVYVAGEFHETADFGATTLVSTGDKESFAAKLSVNGDFLWAKRWGTTEHNMSDGGDIDAQGNFYVVSRQGDGDLDILKYSGNGSLTWSRSLATAFWVPSDLEVNASGSVYVAGTFQGLVDFDPSSKVKYVSAGPSAAGFVLNLDTAGKFNWVTPFVGKTVNSTNGYAFAHAITLDNSGGVIVGGLYRNTVDFNPSTVTTTLDPLSGAFVAKLNTSGGLAWARAFTNNGSGVPTNSTTALTTDSAGNIYATGYFQQSIDLDPGAASDIRTTNGSSDVFIAKLTATGNYIWGETLGGVSGESSHGVAVDNAGNVHMAISYSDQVDFDPSPTTTQLFGSPGAKRNGLRLRLSQA